MNWEHESVNHFLIRVHVVVFCKHENADDEVRQQDEHQELRDENAVVDNDQQSLSMNYTLYPYAQALRSMSGLRM